nr:hypothetical protein BaRGS_000006 [Batillaria attramentaria]
MVLMYASWPLQDGLIGEEVEKAAGMSVQRPKKGFSVDRLLQEVLGASASTAEAEPVFQDEFGAKGQNMTLVNKALELNCDINHINAFGNSPLILVSRLDMPEMCRLLVENGADMNARDRFRETPLLASVYFGCESNARVLIQHGAALDLVDDNNTSAIYWAIFNNRERTLKLLLLAGVHFTPEILSHYPRNIRVMHNGPLYSWLRHHVSNPRSLRSLSCLRVRKHLGAVSNGRSIVGRIAALPLPTFLKDILLLKDCFEVIDESCTS